MIGGEGALSVKKPVTSLGIASELHSACCVKRKMVRTNGKMLIVADIRYIRLNEIDTYELQLLRGSLEPTLINHFKIKCRHIGNLWSVNVNATQARTGCKDILEYRL